MLCTYCGHAVFICLTSVLEVHPTIVLAKRRWTREITWSFDDLLNGLYVIALTRACFKKENKKLKSGKWSNTHCIRPPLPGNH